RCALHAGSPQRGRGSSCTSNAAAGHIRGDQWLFASPLRGAVAEALIELGSTADAAQLIDSVTQGKVSDPTRFDYKVRATLEMLRGNLDDAHQRWLDIAALPLDL